MVFLLKTPEITCSPLGRASVYRLETTTMDIECEPEVVDLKPDTVKIEVKRVDQELAEKEK